MYSRRIRVSNSILLKIRKEEKKRKKQKKERVSQKQTLTTPRTILARLEEKSSSGGFN
jgi:hypothetical protein